MCNGDGDRRRQFLGSRSNQHEDERRGQRCGEREGGRGVKAEGPFPLSLWLHPHATAAAVEARNLATVARYNRYCGCGLNGGELELSGQTISHPVNSDNPTEENDIPRRPTPARPAPSRSRRCSSTLTGASRSIAPSPRSAHSQPPPSWWCIPSARWRLNTPTYSHCLCACHVSPTNPDGTHRYTTVFMPLCALPLSSTTSFTHLAEEIVCICIHVYVRDAIARVTTNRRGTRTHAVLRAYTCNVRDGDGREGDSGSERTKRGGKRGWERGKGSEQENDAVGAPTASH